MATAGLLVTGCFRSGTTLLEKLLHNHPQLAVASQPCPVLYHFVKELFLAERGLERRYALDHLCGEDGYTRADLDAFLTTFELDEARVAEVFDRLANYGVGLWTPRVFEIRDRVGTGPFAAVFRDLQKALGELHGKPDAAWFGSKEIVVEEYAPHLLGQGIRTALIVRDPRDVITSLSFRKRDNQTGAQRPILFSLRAWRKSVAFALALESDPGFATMRYEDLVADPRERLAAMTAWLGVDDYPASLLDGELRDQDGKPWRGNSSFADRVGVTSSARGGFENLMPDDVVRYVEAVCGPEMRALGYEMRHDPADVDEAVLAGFREPFTVDHASFEPDYSYAPSRVADELARFALLDADRRPDDATLERWFVMPGAYDRLQRR